MELTEIDEIEILGLDNPKLLFLLRELVQNKILSENFRNRPCSFDPLEYKRLGILAFRLKARAFVILLTTSTRLNLELITNDYV